jgi:hypothetical protein
MRPSLLPTLLACLLATFVMAFAPAARADDTGVWKAFKGKIIVSDQPLGAAYPTDGAMIAGLRKLNRTVIAGEDGSWTLNLMVFLKQPAGAAKINIVYYDITNPKAPEQVNFAEVDVQPTQKTVAVNGVPLSKEMGIVAGHKYEVRATRLEGGKEVVYSRATVVLK